MLAGMGKPVGHLLIPGLEYAHSLAFGKYFEARGNIDQVRAQALISTTSVLCSYFSDKQGFDVQFDGAALQITKNEYILF